MSSQSHPIDGQIVVFAGAKASVPPERLSELLFEVQADLGPRIDDYRRGYERIHETPERSVFLVETSHWETVGDRLGFERREWDAVRRAHEEQFLRIGRNEKRNAEFENALEIRDVVLVGTAD
jgi:hypothetical protein